MNHIYDTFLRKVDILSKALEKSTERTRTMLYFVTFFSLLILVTSFNAYLAWDRKLNAHERMLLSEELMLIPSSSLKPYNKILTDKLRSSSIEEYRSLHYSYTDSNIAHIIHDLQNNYSKNTIATIALDEYIKDLVSEKLILSQSDYFKLYLDRQKFTIPLVGLSCYADDLYLIGGLGLVILLTYSFFSVRRENRIVERIEKNIQYIAKEDSEKYLHVNSYTEVEIALIKHNLLEYVFYSCVEFFIFNTGLTKTDRSAGKKEKTNIVGRWVLSALYFFPIFSMLFALFFEVKSFVDRFNYINPSDHVELYIRYGLALAFVIINVWQSLFIRRLNMDNSRLIDKMYDEVKKSRENLGLD